MMKKTLARTVPGYIADAPKEFRSSLKAVRKAIREAAPTAEEGISYHIPAYKQDGQLIYFFAAKHHLSILPITKVVRKALAKELKQFNISGYTLHFTPEHSIPSSLIKKILKLRLKENQARKAVKR